MPENLPATSRRIIALDYNNPTRTILSAISLVWLIIVRAQRLVGSLLNARSVGYPDIEVEMPLDLDFHCACVSRAGSDFLQFPQRVN